MRSTIWLAFAMIGSCQAFGRSAIRSTSFIQTLRPVSRPCYIVQRSFIRLSSSNDHNSVEPTWTYTPYKPPPSRPRRNFGSWTVPKHVNIPEDKIEISFTRSSGAGGQNVNKLSTKADLRFHVMTASWIPLEVRERLSEQQASRINKEGFLTIQSQEHRTQAQNKKSAFSKLQQMILEAYPRPKKRNMRKGLSKVTKQRRKEDKRKRSQVKASRRKVDF